MLRTIVRTGVLFALFMTPLAARAALIGDFDCDGKADSAEAVATDGGFVWTISYGSGATAENVTAKAAEELFAGASACQLNTRAATVTVGGIVCNRKLSAKDGPGNFTYNPYNSKLKMKFILPSRYLTTLSKLQIAKNGKILETLPRTPGNEWGNRPRYYSKRLFTAYGKNVVEVLNLKNGSKECVVIPDPTQRYD